MKNKVFAIILYVIGAIAFITEIVFSILNNAVAIAITAGLSVAAILITVSIYCAVSNKPKKLKKNKKSIIEQYHEI